MRGADALVRALERAGVDTVFGIPGGACLPVYDALHDSPPVLFGDHRLTRVEAGNRYGLPDFYQLHAWIWSPNPRGLFDDWSSKVSCLGKGDTA